MHHPEDRYEPDDDVADKIRANIREIQSVIGTCDVGMRARISLHTELKQLRVALANRLYGE